MNEILYILFISLTPALALFELKLVHVIFAHKLYTPLRNTENGETTFPKNLSYEYFNSATVDMPNTAKLNMYKLGVYLRETYDDFFGKLYTSDTAKMRTTEYALSMLSAQLVNAGLWPPSNTQKWNENISWQPIPTDYEAMQKDTLLLGSLCPNFLFATEKELHDNEMKTMITYHKPLFDYISTYLGRKIDRPEEIAFLYASLETSADRNETLPSWAEGIFPYGEMYNVTLLQYDLLSRTPLQRQLNGGTLLKEIIANCLKYIHGNISNSRKLMIYSGDERNIIGTLKVLDLWSPHIPNEAASVIFELYFDNDTETHGIKIKYYTGIDDKTISLTLPNCTEICPLDTIINTIFEYIPENEDALCGWPPIGYGFMDNSIGDLDNGSNDENNMDGSNSSTRHQAKSTTLLVVIACLLARF